MEKQKVAIIGAGNMGTALAVQVAKNNYPINLFTIEEDVIEQVKTLGENQKYLPGIKLNNMEIFGDYESALKDVKYVVLSVPSNIIPIVIKDMLPLLNEKHILINVAKGLDEKTKKSMVQFLEDLLPENLKNRIVTLSGPSIAKEFAHDVLTAVVIASKNSSLLEPVRKLFNTDTFKVFINNDIAGVSFGGFCKNVIAIAGGICDGLNLGVNTKAAVVARGFYELSLLAKKAGADQITLTGLSGLGDLIVTSFSEHSRNRRFGEKIAQGLTFDQAKEEIGQVVEGVTATKIAKELADEYGIKVNLINEIYKILYEGKSPSKAIEDFFGNMGVYEF